MNNTLNKTDRYQKIYFTEFFDTNNTRNKIKQYYQVLMYKIYRERTNKTVYKNWICKNWIEWY